jgi:hypothetical protein
LEDARTTQDGTIPPGGPEFIEEISRLFAEGGKDFLERLKCVDELKAKLG